MQQCNVIRVTDTAALLQPILEFIHRSSECMHNALRRTEVLLTLLKQLLTKHVTLVTSKTIAGQTPIKISGILQQYVDILRLRDRPKGPG